MQSYKNRKKIIRLAIMAAILAGSVPLGIGAAGNGTVPNNMLPQNGHFVAGGQDTNITSANNVMNVKQDNANAVIKWQSFDIGANGTVNFSKDGGGNFNTLNYVTGGNASQIYGKMNAAGGNIYLVNPNGVQIGNSAQINVGSLYVSNRKIDNIDNLNTWNGNEAAIGGTVTTAELMSLGNIQANTVTFDGDRVVIDGDRIQAQNVKAIGLGNDEGYDIVWGVTKDSTAPAGNVKFLGRDAQSGKTSVLNTNEYTYTWVQNASDLQGIKDNLSGNYALRHAIDLTGVTDFTPIGSEDAAFKGKLDGLGYNIFGLTLTEGKDYTGLFGYTDGAIMGYLNLISGTDSTDITGGQYVGALIGYAKDTKVKSVTSTLNVTGTSDVGGLIGHAEETAGSNKSKFYNLINTGTISGHENAGGLIGSMNGGSLGAGETNAVTDEESHNIGRVTGDDTNGYSRNIGGLVGFASGASIGNAGGKVIYNGSAVTGGYNVGGIVGRMENSMVQNAANDANITAAGYIGEKYIYHGNTKITDRDHDGTPGENTIQSVNAANAGGIAGNVIGSTIRNVRNTGNVQSKEIKKDIDGDRFYAAGNVGGIAGRAENTDISHAENKENEIRGAHNVGGIAGYFGGTWDQDADRSKMYAISGSLNNGGDIIATGARDAAYAVQKENVIKKYNTESNQVTVGNMGGIAGYMYGDNTQITGSANRGLVHSQDIEADIAPDNVPESAKAGNAGGVVGKIDRGRTLSMDDLKKDANQAAVVDSYNTGRVQGYANLGGVAGMMYHGEVTGSYNTGNIRSTRIADSSYEKSNYTPVNMGGIVGETTEQVNGAYVSLYDVYNRGNLGDSSFKFGARHVGGIAGRFSGSMEQAYNKGNIYNNMIATGGLAGLWTGTGTYNGSISSSFNAGNITVLNKDHTWDLVSLGGIVGSTSQRLYDGTAALTISHVYNLGALRSFNTKGQYQAGQSIGGIVGTVNHLTKNLIISNVYTTGELYAAFVEDSQMIRKDEVHSVYGAIYDNANSPKITNAYYIAPSDSQFANLADGKQTGDTTTDSQAVVVALDDKDKADSYRGLFDGDNDHSDTSGSWRIYDGTTPILNEFLPKLAEDDVNQNIQNNAENIASIQYGNAYNPFATLITAKEGSTITINDENAGAIDGVDSIIVRGGGLTVKNAVNTGNTMYSGTLYADGALTLSGSQISLGSISNLYGSTVTVNSDGDLKAYGNIISTGANGENGVTIQTTGGGNVEILGLVKTAAESESITVEGMNDAASDKTIAAGRVADSSAAMPEVGAQYSFDVNSKANGSISISAKDQDGHTGNVDVLYGNLGRGHLASSGDVSITGGDIFTDSDLTVAGKIDIYSDSTHNAVIEVSHLGGTSSTDGEATAEAVQKFFDDHKDDITFYSSDNEAVNAKIAIDMWKDGAFDFTKFDKTEGTTLGSLLESFQVNSGRQAGGEESITQTKAADVVYTWVSTADQLAGIQTYAEKQGDDKAKDILGFNFALKNDIDASTITDYKAIGRGDTAYTGHFDGMDHRIIGLEAAGGLFGTIGGKPNPDGTFSGEHGSVDNVRIYSSKITTDSNGRAGAIAAQNNGMISNVIGLGNSIFVGKKAEDGTSSIGGLAGSNTGFIEESSDMSTVIAGAGTVAGGLAGTNSGSIFDVETSSAVTTNLQAGSQKISDVGGIAGTNTGEIGTASVHGVTGKTGFTETAGGITGSNSGRIENVYNESILRGTEGIGGIAGVNTNSITNAANAMEVKGDDGNSTNIGGLVGDQQSGSITNGRNTGTITGHKNVGGLVGTNGKDSTLSNLENGPTASITGDTNVGGLAGSNAGTIKADDNGLVSYGQITGNENVGGIAGANTNTGVIENVNSHLNLNAKGDSAQYFGGVAGKNDGRITNAVYSGTLTADNAQYAGGITGWNTTTGILEGAEGTESVIGNEGTVIGGSYVGGIAGKNEHEIASGVLYNMGTVTANGTVGGAGGIFGENTADISGTSMINTVDGKVTGQGTIGGLIGKNSGTISGGRDSGDNYYQHYIVNNGTVDGGTGAGVGGLIGINEAKGSLTAAYNTGAVKGGDSTGGIVGTNSGKIDQVFNTVMMKDGQNTITGTTNAGGIVGTNSGSVTNAYNTSEVKGNTAIGQIVGTNSGTISNVYGSGALIGSGTDSVTNGYNISQTGTDWQKQNSYGDFDFTGSDGKAEWKIYEGHGNPLLKVFLTKVTYNENQNKQELIYNGLDQSFKVGQLITDGALATTDPEHDNFAAYYANHTLIQSASHKNAGTYYDWLYSGQIGSSGKDDTFNPNHLGYDVSLESASIGKRQITVTDFLASIVYGDQKGHGLVLDTSTGTLQDIVTGDDVHLDLSGKQLGIAPGSVYDTAKGNKVTADVSDTAYAGLTVHGLEITGSDAKNYDFTGTGTGSIKVTPADLTIQVNDETIMKGQIPHYSIGSINGLVNGDSMDSLKAGVQDSSVEGVIGTHTDAIGVWQKETWYNQDNASSINTNYTISLTPGTLTVLDLITPPTPDDRWDSLFDDNPWGRQRNFRERKAEIYFLEGAFWY